MIFEDKYLDVLQNIEFGIITVYKQYQDLSDYDVMRALESIIDHYIAEKLGRLPRQFSLSDKEDLICKNVKQMCEWRLGRTTIGVDKNNQEEISINDSKTIDEIIDCLKRILKSVNKWNKRGGRQGYLKFVSQYIK